VPYIRADRGLQLTFFTLLPSESKIAARLYV
jgi:hypothetical protein